MAATSQAYPVTVRGTLQPDLGRWRWLYKWILVLPHMIALVFLWLAAIVLTVVAGVSIAFTGRYPRWIFDFVLGVMRWSWRVEFYAFTLASDRYPRFTLELDPDDPAQLDVEYPEHLSRGLVWIKWWLLAIPHLIVVGLFSGGANWGGGLVGILCLVAGVMLAVKQRYPQSIFDFVMGMHRWSWRVAAYVLLMRDEYPPFRIDMGPDEPTAPAGALPDPRPTAPTVRPTGPSPQPS